MIYTLQVVIRMQVHVVEDYLIHSSHQFKRLNYDGCIASPKVTGIITLMVIVVMLLVEVSIIYITTCTGSYLEKRRQKQDQESLLYS